MTIQVTTRFKAPKQPKRKEPNAASRRPGMDSKHVAAIRRLPSCISGKSPCEAHHLRIKAERGVGMRSTDRWCVPLTAEEHRDCHKVGSRQEAMWFRKRGIANVYELAAALWFNRNNEEAMLRVLEAHRGKA